MHYSSNIPSVSNRKHHFLLAMLLFIPSFYMVLSIWFPFGFSLGALIEEWGVLGLYINNGLFFITHSTSPLAAHALRPLTIFPHSVAFLLDPNSFDYWHLSTILSLIVKGVAASYLLWKATGSIRFAVLMGILVLIYPADTMQLSFRGLHINWSLSLLLLSSAFFVAALEHKNSVVSYGIGLIGSFLFFTAITMYEAALPCLFLPFMVLYVAHGFKNTASLLGARIGLCLLWFASIGVYFIYVLYTAPKISSYQGALLGGQSVVSLFIHLFPKLFSIGVLRSLIGGWFDAIRMCFYEFATYGYLYLLFITGLIGAFLVFIKNSRFFASYRKNSSFNCYIRLGVIGLLLLILGYIPSLLSHLYISQRTFLFASIGAAMFWIALLALLSYWNEKLSLAFSVFLIFIGIGAQLVQFHHYMQISNTQKYLLRNIVEQFDGNLDNKTLVILDGSNQLNRTWMFIVSNLQNALAYMYDHPIPAIQVCSLPHYSWQLMDTMGRPGTCVKEHDNWVFKHPKLVDFPGIPNKTLPDLVIPKNEVITLRIKSNGSIASNSALDAYRKQLGKQDSIPALRFQNILLNNSWSKHFKNFWRASDKHSYQLNLGRWWSLDLPMQGEGWQEQEWQVNKFYHQVASWKIKDNAFLQFKLHPLTNEYLLSGKLTNIINEQIRQSIQISINQHPIIYHWIGYGTFEAKVPSKILLAGINTIEFKSLVDHHMFDLSFGLAEVKLNPIHS